jgi:putative transposase
MNTYKRYRCQLGAPHQISSPTPSGSIIVSISAIGISKIYSLNAASLSAVNPSVSGTQSTRCAHGAGSVSNSALYIRRLKRKHRGYGDTFYIDEVFVKINGKQHYLWRAVDQDGEVVDVYLQAKRDGAAAKRFLKRLLRSHGDEPRKIVTDKLRSYGVAHRELMPEAIHSTKQYENNRAEQSHEATRVRERGMRRFKSVGQAQRLLDAHAAVYNLFNLGRHLVKAQHYRDLRMSAFAEWNRAAA